MAIRSKLLFCFTLLFLDGFTATAQKPELYVETGHSGFVNALSFSPDGKLLATGGGSMDMSVKIWDVRTGQEITAFRGHTSLIRAVAFSPD